MEYIPAKDPLQVLRIDGEDLAVKYLGNGLYSWAYQAIEDPSRVFILVNQTSEEVDCKPRDRSKEVLALAKTYHNNKHIPAFKLHGMQRVASSTFEVWETKYSKSAPASDGCEEHVTPEAAELANVYPVKAEEVESKIRLGDIKVSPSLVEALQDIEHAAQAFNLNAERWAGRHYHFDLHRGNFGLDPESNTLILRDPISAFF